MSRGEASRPKDSDLRQAAHAHGARPSSDLWSLLVELQCRRDEDAEKALGADQGPSPDVRGHFASPL